MARPLSYFPGRPRTQSDWIIPNWLKRGNTGFMIGQPKRACKSWLLLNLAWDLSEGIPLWGVTNAKTGPIFELARPMRVVYFAQEDSEDDVQDRVELIANAGRAPNENLWIIPKDLKLRLDDAPGLTLIQSELDQVAATGAIDLVILDPMRRMHYKSENDSENMAHLWQVLDTIHHRYHCATLFSHHIIKPPTAKGSKFDLTSPFAARGSGDIYGGGDAFINVDPTPRKGQTRRAHERTLTLHFETKRAAPMEPIRLTLDMTKGTFTFDGFGT